MSKVLDYIIDNYEITNFPQYGSCFLTQDGYFIFPDKKGEKSSLTFHDDLLDDLYENFSSQEVNSFIDSCFILNSRTAECKIGLSKTKPSKEQYNSLLEWIDYLYNANVCHLQIISDKNYLIINLKEYIPEDIINIVRRYYLNELLRENIENLYKTFFHYKCLEEIADIGIKHNVKERLNKFIISCVDQMTKERENFYRLNFIEDEGVYNLLGNLTNYHIYAIKNISLKIRVYFIVYKNTFYIGSADYKKEDRRDDNKIKQLLERVTLIINKQK